MSDARAVEQDDTAATALQREAERFLHHEARLLDSGRFAEWLDLFAPEGVYWAPSVRGQADPLNLPSIMHEDRAILAMRVQRLLEARALVLTPMPRTVHLLTNIEVLRADDVAIEAEAAFIVNEYQDGTQRLRAGRSLHRLLRTTNGLRIGLKRVDLIDCDGVHSPITVPL